jgi:hypothetical protein
MYYIGLDVHKRTIKYCVKDGSGTIRGEGTIPATRFDLDRWMKTLPRPWTRAMEATVFTAELYLALGDSGVCTVAHWTNYTMKAKAKAGRLRIKGFLGAVVEIGILNLGQIRRCCSCCGPG